MIDAELYGGKRGLLEHALTRVLYALGAYGDIRDIEWAAVGRLVFVCKGNICRSPYASARARSLGVRAVSFGLAAVEGSPADPTALRNASLRGLDLSKHRSTKMDSFSFTRDDLIVVFEPKHLSDVRRLNGRRIPACLLGIWSEPIHPHIHDPYGRGDRYFQRCFSLIDDNVAKLAGRLPGGAGQAPAGEASRDSRATMVTIDPCNRTLG